MTVGVSARWTCSRAHFRERGKCVGAQIGSPGRKENGPKRKLRNRFVGFHDQPFGRPWPSGIAGGFPRGVGFPSLAWADRAGRQAGVDREATAQRRIDTALSGRFVQPARLTARTVLGFCPLVLYAIPEKATPLAGRLWLMLLSCWPCSLRRWPMLQKWEWSRVGAAR